MKRIGYIQGARIRGPVDLGPGGTLNVPGASNLRGLTIMYAGLITAGVSTFGGVIIASAGLSAAGAITLGGPTICSSSFGVAGATTLNGAVICSSTLAVAAGGILTFPQTTIATQLPAADPTVAGELWCNAGVVTRSAG